MAIKELFSTSPIPTTSLEEEVVRKAPELESGDNVAEQKKRIERFIPPLNYSDPSTFARYGSAESYYEDAITRIYNQYPYDGSEREIQEFLNESNYVDLHIYDNLYPRTTGYAVFSSDGWGTLVGSMTEGWGSSSAEEYISVVGGPHTSSGGIPTGELRKAFGEPDYRTTPNANIYDADIYGTAEVDTLDRVASRESNLQYKLSNGLSVEFWLKKDAWISSLTEKEAIFDLWNGEASSSAGYGRFLLYLTASSAGTLPMRLHFASGSNVRDVSVLPTSYTTASIGDGNWHHYAVTLQSSSLNSNVEMKSYVDGALAGTQTSTTNIAEVTGSLKAYIGALQTSPSGNAYHGTTMTGYGKLSGSLDEFRFWKNKRTERDIQRNWWTQVRGGTNTDISNADLGVYFKFNEGITETSSIDSIVLDYSGRISNGSWVGYPSSNARNTGSAIDSSAATVTGTVEFKDPIIYSNHSEVASLYNAYKASGSSYDHSNVSSIMDSLPTWIVEEDDAKGSGHLKKLTQIIGSYFDAIHLQIQHLPKIAEVGYPSASHKPIPFSERLLSSYGFEAPETFVEASILEKFANRRDDRGYSLDINNVKNQIYQNIYNNLMFIYKSKGTEKAFRNLIRCYGIDEEVIKLNAYGNNTTFRLEDTYYDATIRKNYIDFNHPDRFTGTVYQNSSSNSETSGISYVTGTNANFANTAEAEIIFPKKMEVTNEQYFLTPFTSASLFGCHVAAISTFSWPTAVGDTAFQAYFVKTAQESKDGHFLLTTRRGSPDFYLTSSVFTNVYDNQKWNLSVRVKDGKYPYASGLTGSDGTDNVTIEFAGYNVELGVVRNEFSVSASGLNDKYLTERRRYYAGASRTDTTGTVVTKTDVRVSSVRHWAHYLENPALLAHAKDPMNFGAEKANKNIIFSANDAGIGIDNIDLPEYASLAFHWDFSQVTGSDSSGEFEVDDASSGSVSLQTRYSSDGNFSYIVANQYAGRGYFPSAVSSTTVVDKNYVAAARQRLPEVVNSNDAVNVLTQDDDLYPSDPAVSQTFFAFEKSMYGVVSQEMMNTFATVVEFNNLIGEMTNKYRGDYKDFTRLRNLFFEKVQNNPDIDKFIDYYKWIDNSLSVMIQQLVPASADVADEIRNVVESHILERSKYRHQMPLLDYKGNARWGGDELVLQGRAFGANELAYDWKHGHAPVTNMQNTNALWWRERAERDKTAFGTATAIDSARQSILDIMLSFNSASYDVQFATAAGTGYDGSAYALRRFASPVRLTTAIDREIRSGYNFSKTQKPEAITNIIKPGSTANLQVTTTSFRDIDVAETGEPILTVKRAFTTQTSDNSKIHSPVGQFSSSLGTTEFGGLHTDAYGDTYETPMQGPFSQEHVGGYQHRHTALNTGSDDQSNRQEAWQLFGGNTFTTRSSMHSPPAYPAYQRDGKAKRPLNIKNVQSTTGSSVLGNYQNIYEVVQTMGRSANNSSFVKSEGFGSSSTVSSFVSSLNDYAKPTRTKASHVFVNRFSAPGGPETAGDSQGGPFLDLESAEYSPYNDINVRNWTVREPLQALLTEHNEQFGYRSGSSTVGAIYKVNKNTLKRLEYTDSTNSTVATASTYDNYYVQHMIPQSDYQYTWITASYISSTTNTYGYWPADGLVSTSAGLVAAMSFSSASDGGGTAFNASNQRRTFRKDNASYIAGTFVPTDYVGLNTTIIEPISGTDFTLGYPPISDVAYYYNYSDIGVFATNTLNQESFVEKIGNTTAAKSAKTDALNGILSHRNGPYGHPTWKQIRVGQGALGRHYRKNNLYTHTPFGGSEKKTAFGGGAQTIKDRRGATLAVTQSVVTSKFHTIKHELLFRTGDERNKQLVKPIMVETSYANGIAYFDDETFANRMGIKIRRGFSAYDQIKKLYLDGALEDPSSPVVGINRVMYTESIWPSEKSAYTKKVRGRTGFTNNFWRDNRVNRSTLAATKKPTNSFGLAVSQSAWVLDAEEDFIDSVAAYGGKNNSVASGKKAGELQNGYVHWHNGSPTTAYAGALYARKHIYPATRSVAPDWGMEIPEMVSASGDAAKPTGIISGEILTLNSRDKGNALWEAATHAGSYEGTSSEFSKTSTSTNPFYDSYDEYFSDIKPKGQDYSIIPEYRVSERSSFYRSRGGDYTSEDGGFLSIAQVPAGTSTPQNSADDNFFKVFTNSDFMKYFEVIREDHRGTLEPHVLRLKCKAIKKFIPYDGFYPAERTVELVKQFNDSYGENMVLLSGSGDYVLSDFDQHKRSLLKPLFSPGILFNTIKSGIAVDYPIMTGSFVRRQTITTTGVGLASSAVAAAINSASYGIFSNGAQAAGSLQAGFDKRLPFETLIHPEKYLANVPVNDDEPSEKARVDSVTAWTGEGDSVYRAMAHNFFAETVGFFVQGGKTTGISSVPESDFKSVTPGQPYGMRIKLYKSMNKAKITTGSWGEYSLPQNTREVWTTSSANPWGMVDPFNGDEITGSMVVTATPRETFTMYSRPSAFGPPLVCEVSTTDSFSGSVHDFSPRNGIYGAHTPGYKDGEAWIDLIYYPRGLQTVTSSGPGHDWFEFMDDVDALSSFRPTLADIFAAPSKTVLESSASGVPLAGTYMRTWRYDQEELVRDATSTYHKKGATYGPAAGPWANKWAMQADASLNVFDIDGEFADKKWRIQTKFETPMLNFNKVTAASGTLTVTSDVSGNATIPRGMWHQFGRLPLENEGVYMQVTDLPADWLANHPSASLLWDLGGVINSSNKSPRVTGDGQAKSYFNGYSIPMGSGSEAYMPPVQSLVDVCGFSTDPVKIGKVSRSTSIYEAIVAVPYIFEDGEKKFFTIPDPENPRNKEVMGESIQAQLRAMERYILPPSFDFVNYPAVNPMAMYFFEFRTKLSQNDISHMWQNLPPTVGRVPEEATSIVSHNLMASELMGDWASFRSQREGKGPAQSEEDFFTYIEDKVQWMVFKVKQRGRKSYYEALVGKEAEAARMEEAPQAFNWPYDYCSIVELAKLDAEVQLGGRKKALGDGELRERIDSHKLLNTEVASVSTEAVTVGEFQTGGIPDDAPPDKFTPPPPPDPFGSSVNTEQPSAGTGPGNNGIDPGDPGS